MEVEPKRTPRPQPAAQLGRTPAGLKERRRAPSSKMPPIESAKQSASTRGDTDRRRVASASIARKPGRFGGSPEQRGRYVNVSFILRFYVDFEKMTFPKCDVHLMISELAITRGRMCKIVRVRELVAWRTNSKKCDVCGCLKSKQPGRERVVSIRSRL